MAMPLVNLLPNINFTLYVCLPNRGFSSHVVLKVQDAAQNTIQTITHRVKGKVTPLNITVPGNTRRIRAYLESVSDTWHYPFSKKMDIGFELFTRSFKPLDSNLLEAIFGKDSFLATRCNSIDITETNHAVLLTVEFQEAKLFNEQKTIARIEIDYKGHDIVFFDGPCLDESLRQGFQEFKTNIVKILTVSGRPIKEVLADKEFLSALEKCKKTQGNKFNKDQVEILKSFPAQIQSYVQTYCQFIPERSTKGEMDQAFFQKTFESSDNGVAIIDYDIPPQGVLLAILLSMLDSNSSIPVPDKVKKACRTLLMPSGFTNKKLNPLKIINDCKALRLDRKLFIDNALKRPEIKEYKLYRNRVLVAEKVNGELCIKDQEGYASCLSDPYFDSEEQRARHYDDNPFQLWPGDMIYSPGWERHTPGFYNFLSPPLYDKRDDFADFVSARLTGHGRYDLSNCIINPLITRQFIQQYIQEKVIPEGSEGLLEKYRDRYLFDAIYEKLHIHIRHSEDIFKSEIEWLAKAEDQKGRYRQYFYISGLLEEFDLSETSLELPKFKRSYKSDPKLLKVFNYLLKKITLEQLNLTPEDALEVLAMAKLCDLAIGIHNCISLQKYNFKRRGLKLRCRILELLPHIESFVVFTKTLHPEKMLEAHYLLDSKNWHPSRGGMHFKELINNYILLRAASQTLDHIIAPRGNSCSGKSTIVKVRSLNVDHFKPPLKRNYKILNGQVHRKEAAPLFEKLLEFIRNKVSINYCLDSRLIYAGDLEKDILAPARKRNVPVEIIDLEVPLLTSFNRLLTRPTYGKEPCPPLEALVDGFAGLRRERINVIRLIESEELVQNYELYCKIGQQRILVAKKQGKINVIETDLFKECLRVPSEEELSRIKKLQITPEIIERAVEEHDIYPEQVEMLKKWCGLTYEEAINLHINGKEPPIKIT